MYDFVDPLMALDLPGDLLGVPQESLLDLLLDLLLLDLPSASTSSSFWLYRYVEQLTVAMLKKSWGVGAAPKRKMESTRNETVHV